MKGILKRIRILSGAVILFITLLISCAFPSQEPDSVQLSDVSSQLTHQVITRLAFMGGSVLYNPERPSTGHLAQGVQLAVRLGKVELENNGGSQLSYSDAEDVAKYGYLTITSIDANHIAFSYTVFNDDKKTTRVSSHSVNLNEQVDINADGIYDLTYEKPSHKRPGMEGSVYLTFISSQEALRTAMFAVIQEQYSRGAYPNGIIGINPDGKFIISKYEGQTTTRSSVQGVVYGDYVLDTPTGYLPKSNRIGKVPQCPRCE
jgi:hypothetical protein